MSPANEEFEKVFEGLKMILQKQAGKYTIKPDTNTAFGLQGKPGAATIQFWGGKLKKPVMPIAWIKIEKNYVSYHVMGLYTNTALLKKMTKELKAHMQGKTCFNFKTINEKLFYELEQLTVKAIDDFKMAAYVA